jgi:signal transduction histidine kinase
MFERTEDFENFEKTLNRIVTLTKNVLNTFRGENNTYRQSSPLKAFQWMKEIAPFHFERKDLDLIDFEFDIPDGVEVLIPQPDLIQVLLNLHGNSVKNLISKQIVKPKIWVAVEEDADHHITFSIRDNGSGLTPETFEFITENPTRLPGQEGVGLKLTKDLVRRYGGSLMVDHRTSETEGTSVLLKLLKAPRYTAIEI